MDTSFHPPEEQFDELVSFEKSTYSLPSDVDKDIKSFGFILDHTAFVRGIGNIERWFNKDYVMENMKWKAGESKSIELYIPSYTFHEFDIVKRGTSIAAINARESINFIDKYFENEATVEGFTVSKSGKKITFEIQMETGDFEAPSWTECTRHTQYIPKVKDFPKFNFTLDYNLVGRKSPVSRKRETQNANFPDSVQAETDANDPEGYTSDSDDGETEVPIPFKLKYLIKSCIGAIKYDSKVRQGKRNWRVITEDPSTKVWCQSFGISCLNVIEAESLIFQNYDNDQFASYNPNSTFDIEDNPNLVLEQVFFNDIDTTKYPYTGLDARRGKTGAKTNANSKPKSKSTQKPRKKANTKPKEKLKTDPAIKDSSEKKSPAMDKEKRHGKNGTASNDKSITDSDGISNTKDEPAVKSDKRTRSKSKRRAKPHTASDSKPKATPNSIVDNVVVDSQSDLDGTFVKKEKFSAINFAPRGQGELWKP